MIELIKKIVTDVLTSLYQPFGFAVIMAFLFMVAFLFVAENGGGLEGVKSVTMKWWKAFRTDKVFRRGFFLAFYTAMILFRTLLNRELWMNPLSHVMGGWGLTDTEGNLTTEAIENLMLFIPFVVLLLWAGHGKLFREKFTFRSVVWQSVKITFLFSLGIEFLQLLLRLGTFQLADLTYNTLGGLIGGIIYWSGWKLRRG